MAFRDYISSSPDKLLTRLADVQEDLATLHKELAFLRQRELEAKTSAWQQSTEQSVTARERDSRLAATPHTASILALEGNRLELEEEKNFLEKLWQRQTIH